MVDSNRNLFKTKLCVLYERGNCSRQSCSFAHGDAELKRFSSGSSASFNGRRDYRGSDLRDKLERRRSPQRRYSPGRDARGRQALPGHRKLRHDRGYSTSRSPSRSEKRQRRKQHLDGLSDISGALKVSDGSDGNKERRAMSSRAKDELEDQLKQVQLDVNMLDNRKSELDIHLEKKVHEADSFVSRIEELETQLNKEQEECKRITSTIKKFIKVHSRYSKAQDDLKRSQARLQKLGDQLSVDASRPNTNDEDSTFNTVSDAEPNGDNGMSPRKIRENYPSSKKRQWTGHEASEEAKTANMRKCVVGTSVLEKLTNVDVLATQSEKNWIEADGLSRIPVRSNGPRSGAYEETSNKRRKNSSVSIDPMEKGKGLEAGHMFHPTCMAAHAVDELINGLEMEKIDVVDAATTVFGKSNRRERPSLPRLPPPPPPPAAPKSAYKQFEGEDVDVDVEELDMEVHDADINNEVDIEQL